MTKNVTVTDENGTYVGLTYPKRARGLVKNGRALFVDDCTIRLSGKTEPSDDKSNQSEVKQMNYIYFNPREWSSEQTQYSTQYQNGNGFYQSGSKVSMERSFVTDFDGSLVESLMFGGWNESYVRVVSRHFSLLPNTEYSFVFWLNGGENDRNNEICQLQIIFFDNSGDCCTYKLNRNYIKPLLHRQGWELYSIPFVTPSAEQSVTGIDQTPAFPAGADQGGFAAASVVDTRFSFVSGNAPMALKPAKEPSFYKDWEDEPDEFVRWRPQRHNIVFEDGWPGINMYGGDRYSTEVLRKKREQGVTGQRSAPKQKGMLHDLYSGQNAEQYRQMMQGVAENVQQKAQVLAANTKQAAKEFAQSTRQKAEYYRENAEQRKNQTERRKELAELLSEFREKQAALTARQKELSERRNELQTRCRELHNRYPENEKVKSRLDTGFDETADEMPGMSALLALDVQFSCASDIVSNQDLPIEAAEGLLDGIEKQLDSVEEMCDNSEEILDELEKLLDEIEDEAAGAEED